MILESAQDSSGHSAIGLEGFLISVWHLVSVFFSGATWSLSYILDVETKLFNDFSWQFQLHHKFIPDQSYTMSL